MTPEGLKEVSERNPEGISNWKQQEVFLEFPNRMELVCLSNARKLLWLEWRGEDEKDGIMIMAHVLSQAKC